MRKKTTNLNILENICEDYNPSLVYHPRIGKISDFCWSSHSTNYSDSLNSDANEAFIKPFYLSFLSFTSNKQIENTQMSCS